jgi:hypothetical protein
MELKAKIINTANLLMDLLEYCHDEDLVETVVNASWNNDKEPLWDPEEQLELDADNQDEYDM